MAAKSFRTQLLEIQDNLYNFAYMLTGNRDNACDLVQDTTLKILDNEDKYVENINFRGWVFTIMRNMFINGYRKAARTPTMVDQTEDLYYINLAQDSALESPEGALGAKEIHRLVHELPDDLRIPFSMHLAGYKYAEISERTGTPVGTVKSRIFFARKRLQSQLKDFR